MAVGGWLLFAGGSRRGNEADEADKADGRRGRRGRGAVQAVTMFDGPHHLLTVQSAEATFRKRCTTDQTVGTITNLGDRPRDKPRDNFERERA
jgi:hypothetical protein